MRVEQPTPRDPKRNIFAEGINYFTVPAGSIWGEEGPNTLAYMDKANISGVLLNLASGDGRYMRRLLENATHVSCLDIDMSALSKLWHVNIPEKDRARVSTVVANLTEPLPFAEESFDGLFSTGTLHFFDEKTLLRVFREIDRVLVPRGKILLNFGTNITRTRSDGTPLVYDNEATVYEKNGTIQMLKDCFPLYELEFFVEPTESIDFFDANPPYTWSSEVVIMLAQKAS